MNQPKQVKHHIKFMAIDQYGRHIFLFNHPRKELLEYHNVKHASKMFVDKIDGSTKHIGYIIAGHWYTLYNVTYWEREA